jgi:alginate biosynthesis protein AlgK
MPNKFIFILFSTFISCPSSWAVKSIEQIKLELDKNPYSTVEQDLHRLSRNGHHEAQLILGKKITTGGTQRTIEALELLKLSYANGHGEVTALAAMAEIISNNTYVHKEYQEYIKKSLARLKPEKNLSTLTTSLEVFLTYPALFNLDRIHELIDLYKKSCLNQCRPQLYQAVLAEQEGNITAADQFYREAVWLDLRAITLYFVFLGSKRDTEFPKFTKTLEPYRKQMSAATAHRIATLLDTIYGTSENLQRMEITLAYHANRKVTGENKEFEKNLIDTRREAAISDLRNKDSEVNRWLDAAIDKNWTPAMTRKVINISTWSLELSPQEAFALVERVEKLEPLEGKALRAGALMITNWPTTNPFLAFELLNELITAGYEPAHLILGDFYARIGQEEADTARALQIFEDQAKLYNPAAFYRIASLLSQGRSICHDLALATAYAKLAKLMGDLRADGLIHRLNLQLDENQKRAVITHETSLIKKFRL